MTPSRIRSSLLLACTAAVVGVVVLSPTPAEGRSTGANPGFAGDLLRADGSPQTCAVCHNSFALNSGAGSVTVDVPATVEPGTTVPLTITVDNQTPETAPGSGRQGFEVIVRDADTGDVWGELVLADGANTRFAGSEEVYVTHTVGGIAQSSWTVDWLPGTDRTGTARIYVAGNAANGNGSSSGDYIYATTADVVVASTSTPTAPQAAFAVAAPRPTPLRSGRRARVAVTMDRPGEVTVTVLDGVGRTVRSAERRSLATGETAVELDTAGLAAGLYFVRVDGPGGRQTQPLSVIR